MEQLNTTPATSSFAFASTKLGSTPTINAAYIFVAANDLLGLFKAYLQTKAHRALAGTGSCTSQALS